MTDRQKGIIALLIVLVAWSLSSLFVKYLIQHGYDPHTQNLYRYAAGTLVVWPFILPRLRRRGERLDARRLVRLLGPAVPNLIHQISWTISLTWIFPALASFLNKSSVLFAALLAALFFPEERWVFRSGRYLTGLTLTVLGTSGLALLRPDLAEFDMNLGVILVLVAAAAWAIYSVSVKRLTAEVGPTACFGVVGVYTTLVLLGPALVWGDLGQWWRAPWQVNAIMISSGVFCIGIAHTLYYYAIRTIGVSICTVMLLTTPLGTLVLSRWLFGEQMTGGQVVAGLALLAGGGLTLFARQRAVPAEASRAVVVAET